MLASQAKRVLEETLEAHGATLESPEFLALWRAFCSYAERPIADLDPYQDEDLVLFHAGMAELKPGVLPPDAGSTAYVVGFLRQLSFTDSDGEYLGMEQLRLDIVFLASPMLARLPETTIWGVAGLTGSCGASRDQEGTYRTVPAWKEAVERSETFQAASSSAPARALLSPQAG